MKFPDEILVTITKLVYNPHSPNSSYKDIRNLLLVNKQFSRVAQEILFELLRICATRGVDKMMLYWEASYGKKVDQLVFHKVKHISLYNSNKTITPKISQNIFSLMAVTPNLQMVSLYAIHFDEHFIPWAVSLQQPVHLSIIRCTFSPLILTHQSYQVASLTLQDNDDQDILFPNCCFPALQQVDLTFSTAWNSITLPNSVRVLTIRGSIRSGSSTRIILMGIRSCEGLDSLIFLGEFIAPSGSKPLLQGPIQSVTAPPTFVQYFAGDAGVRLLDIAQSRSQWSFIMHMPSFVNIQELKFRIKGDYNAEGEVEDMLEKCPTATHVTIIYDYSENLVQGVLAAFVYGQSITHLAIFEEGQQWLRVGPVEILGLKSYVEDKKSELNLEKLRLNGSLIWSRTRN
ncbi:hypothetical protein FB446DRAFT_708039 [Lentinula raphanica]|nr:hypothetical protein FB446DRAFT_708039 [Lentinula raphanica]